MGEIYTEMNRDTCLKLGGVWVDGYRKKNGTYVKGHCSSPKGRKIWMKW